MSIEKVSLYHFALSDNYFSKKKKKTFLFLWIENQEIFFYSKDHNLIFIKHEKKIIERTVTYNLTLLQIKCHFIFISITLSYIGFKNSIR